MGNQQGKPVIFTDQGASISPYTRQLAVTRADSLCLAVNLNHFRLLRVVGKGAFGKVRIVERKDNGCTYALKYIRKDEGTPARNTHTRIERNAELTRTVQQW